MQQHTAKQLKNLIAKRLQEIGTTYGHEIELKPGDESIESFLSGDEDYIDVKFKFKRGDFVLNNVQIALKVDHHREFYIAIDPAMAEWSDLCEESLFMAMYFDLYNYTYNLKRKAERMQKRIDILEAENDAWTRWHVENSK